MEQLARQAHEGAGLMFEYTAEPIHVVDGDTVDLKVDLGFSTFVHQRFRLYGVNTPERGQPGYQEATDFVAKWLSAQSIITVKTFKDRTEKYGRYLALLSGDGEETLNHALIAAGLAVEYYGGKR